VDMPQLTPKRKWLDALSIGLSGLCVVHCLALPVIAGFLPTLGTVLGWDGFHQALVLTALPASVWAMMSKKGWRRLDVVAPLSIGFVFLIAAAFVPALVAFETPLSVIGALLIALAHWRNMKAKPKAHTAVCDKNSCACTLP
jgi:hypothetical protein